MRQKRDVVRREGKRKKERIWCERECVCVCEREMAMRVVNDDVSLSNNQLICSQFCSLVEKKFQIFDKNKKD